MSIRLSVQSKNWSTDSSYFLGKYERNELHKRYDLIRHKIYHMFLFDMTAPEIHERLQYLRAYLIRIWRVKHMCTNLKATEKNRQYVRDAYNAVMEEDRGEAQDMTTPRNTTTPKTFYTRVRRFLRSVTSVFKKKIPVRK
ncbi:hypothetical protein GCK72_022128 [Caenorhabditis remanei]|uniref:Uncharacterized protein n=1 Tax=Caenorhabditis remanei TaxID=31234 RepID=A0A6A5FTG8_CAERE|nr:hypothetical protein GCK72_022128 [Caenorhabditis remanei]KAF1745681.1 hypothetical protein GCK72_022128 [Caenorhabditis remanei]